ncbi:MAG: hypothetical protein Q7J98_05135 [Kiritimatiellia bacterium]|nr:hypothetical protein [Kiritimatiellia bacterium]
MKKISYLAVFLSVLFVGALGVKAQELIYKGADATEAIRVYYDGTANATTTTVTLLSIAMNDGLVNQSHTFAATTLEATIAAINAFTNQAGAAGSYRAEYWGGVAADILSNNVVGITSAIPARVWTKIAKFDTSAILHYDVVVFADGAVQMKVNQIMGQPTGTGKITVNAYVDGNKAYEWIHPGVEWYVSDATGTNYASNADIPVNLALPGGIAIPRGKKCVVRATRATTATTGLLSVIAVNE